MAFATKYTVDIKDVLGTNWSVDFQEDGFGGSETSLTGGVNPFMLTYEQSDKYQPIIGSYLDVNLVYDSNIDTLFTEDMHDIKVNLVKGAGTNIWSGFLLPGQFFRQFNQPKHYVTLTANCGLGDLKNIEFRDGSDDPYFGQQTEIVVIANILLKTGFTSTIRVGIDIFDTNQTASNTTTPLAQTYIYQEAYWDEQTGESASCYDVLSDILKKYGACIKRYRGFWLIYRPNGFSRKIFRYRDYTSAGVYSSSSNTASYYDMDSDTYYVHADQELSKEPAIGECQVTQIPPRRSNMFKNGSFDDFTWTAGVPDYWDDVYSSGTTLDMVESSGKLKIGACGNSSTPTEYIECTVHLYYVNSITVSFDATPTYTGSPTYKNYIFQLYDGGQYLTAGGWQAPEGWYAITAGTSGTAERCQIEVPEQSAGQGFSKGIQLRFRIYEFYNENAPATNYYILDNLRLEVDMDLPSERIYSFSNSSYTIYNTKKTEIALGDSWRGDFFATNLIDDAYFINTYNAGTNLTSSWQIYGDATAGAKIGEVLARQYVQGAYRYMDKIRGTVRTDDETLTMWCIRDSNFTDEWGWIKSFLPMGVTHNIHKNEIRGEWIECTAIMTDEGLEWDPLSDTYDDSEIDAYQVTLDEAITGTELIESESYTAVAGEIVRVKAVLTLTSGDAPNYAFDGQTGTLSEGTNYLEFQVGSAGAKEFQINHTDGETADCVVVFTLYSLTGI